MWILRVWLVTVMLLTLLGVGSIIGAVVDKAFGASLTWDRSAEIDMQDYGVYSCSPNPSCTVVKDPANRIAVIPQTIAPALPVFPIPAAFEGKLAVTAKDLSGNESGLSVSIPFDSRPPQTPVNPRVAP